MQELVLNPVTVVLLLVIVGCVVLALRRLLRRGLCDCGDHGDGGCAGCAGCSSAAPDDAGAGAGSCPAAEAVVSRAEQESKR